MKLVYDSSDPVIQFGVDQIKKGLLRRDIFYVEQYEKHVTTLYPSKGIVVRKVDERKINESYNFEDEAFLIRRKDQLIIIEGKDSRGVMYGCLEWAECIERGKQLLADEQISQKPSLQMRGIKYNLPYAPFDQGDALLENEDTCMNMEYWRPYIDMLAKNRYNCLSLWSEHPFHLMVVSSKYREANPYDDQKIKANIQFFRNLMKYAKDRGIDIFLFTWNIRLLPEVATGLGYPSSVGEFGNMYDHLIHRVGTTLNRFRETSEIIKDYFYEMILQVLLTYPDLKGIGTSASEWMDGTGYEKEAWIAETYIKAIKESGRQISFIHRTNMQSAGREIKDVIQEQFDSKDLYISWKYSNAHCYSHSEPQFEKLWGAWKGIDLEKTQVLYTVRNDDVFTFRWGEPDYVRAYVKGMLKPYVKGFYWGADGYIWGKDFQHVNYGHKTWTYDFEKHLFQFQLWGRLSYNPDIEDEVWEHLLQEPYGKAHAGKFLTGLREASKIIPAVNRLFWMDYDFQWHPESCLSQVSGFKTILDFVEAKAMPGSGVMSINEFVIAENNGVLEEVLKDYRETPNDIVIILEECTKNVEEILIDLERTSREVKSSHYQCTQLDLYAWVELGRYYQNKFKAAIELKRYSLNYTLYHKNLAISLLEEASTHWERLGHYWILHNKPYFMARVKMTFGYPYYLEDTYKDIEYAKQFGYRENTKIKD
ncbi:hypothetical protein GI584_19910 [Gracilibacillus salitolerans]|uniref:Beta-hexosaminidase bacterial type N-terminal domain-containing protein n=1 Tax=Gracilibacillus salitolerans TaxID=2663022 RepID=A0A5Q2TPS0_9BACI|nr:hypothetical protein [Gracilibacillus salitolerans]QGH36171.1 hypothetical protein GI584_19910 [Gracilibacillus salitolerans]